MQKVLLNQHGVPISQNYPAYPDWLREAKFGIWVHFGPQALGMSGDWYARRMYLQGQPAYINHIGDFGHPSETGYMDVLHSWNPTKLDPAQYVKLYHNAGARFLFIQGVHHDNFDLWIRSISGGILSIWDQSVIS